MSVVDPDLSPVPEPSLSEAGRVAALYGRPAVVSTEINGYTTWIGEEAKRTAIGCCRGKNPSLLVQHEDSFVFADGSVLIVRLAVTIPGSWLVLDPPAGEFE